MAKNFVDVLSLNFRTAPVVDPANKVGTLFLGQLVDVTAPAEDPAWVRVSATLHGQAAPVEGFVSRRFLRDPVSGNREALIAAAIAQWMRFERGLGKEFEDPFFRFVGEMWQKIGFADLDGLDRDVPWSAAAISFFARNAGEPYNKFKFAAAHARYIHDSIKQRDANDQHTPFWGFRLHERRPQLGDLVCKWRESPVDFDTAQRRSDFKSHCDVVVKIDSEKNELLAIGGNVNQSVSTTIYRLAPSDFLDDSGNVFALLANITDGA